METSDKIKRGLECCINLTELDDNCSPCPYYGEKLACVDKDIDALAYIKQLEQRVPRWISVEERLPEEKGNYLVRCYFRTQDASYTYKSIKIIHFRGKTRWATENEYITHWMPLPEPPEEG